MKGMKVLITIGTHGDEKIGTFVVEKIKRLPLKDTSGVSIITANEKASSLNRRYVDQDLNRSFPGKKTGNHEERLAYKLSPLVKAADLVIDIHSTTSSLKDALIITRLNKKTEEYIKVIKPKYLLLMKATGNTALISQAKAGLAFEYGKDKDPKVISKIASDIERLFDHLKMLEKSPAKKPLPNYKTASFSVEKIVPKEPGYRLMKTIKNYKKVTQGEVYASNKSSLVKAEEEFYPILFGQKNYETIFGFAGKKIDLL